MKKIKFPSLKTLAVNAVLWAMPVLVIGYRVFFTLYNR